MAHDCLMIGDCFPVVHHPGAKPNSPEWSCSKFVGCGLIGVLWICALDYTISGSHVVEQEVAKGMNYFSSKSLGNGISPAVNSCSGRCRYERPHMTKAAADYFENLRTCLG